MGRGLGCLQKAILLIAYEKHKRDPAANVTFWEILTRHYGFTTYRKHISAYWEPESLDRRAIGYRRCNSATVTVSQCFGRLAERGLVEYELCHGVRLTEAGVRQARKILAQTRITPAQSPT
jgi:hypothetical protein